MSRINHNIYVNDLAEDSLEDIWSIIGAILPAIPGVVAGVFSLFKKRAPTLSDEQLKLLGTLPLKYQQMAVNELEASPNMQTAFSAIYGKYLAMANADKKKTTIIIAVVGGGVILFAAYWFLLRK